MLKFFTDQNALENVVASINRLSIEQGQAVVAQREAVVAQREAAAIQQRILEVVVVKEKSIPLSKITKTTLGKILEIHLIDFLSQPDPATQPVLSIPPFSWKSDINENNQSDQYLSYLSRHLSISIGEVIRTQ